MRGRRHRRSQIYSSELDYRTELQNNEGIPVAVRTSDMLDRHSSFGSFGTMFEENFSIMIILHGDPVIRKTASLAT